MTKSNEKECEGFKECVEISNKILKDLHAATKAAKGHPVPILGMTLYGVFYQMFMNVDHPDHAIGIIEKSIQEAMNDVYEGKEAVKINAREPERAEVH